MIRVDYVGTQSMHTQAQASIIQLNTLQWFTGLFSRLSRLFNDIKHIGQQLASYLRCYVTYRTSQPIDITGCRRISNRVSESEGMAIGFRHGNRPPPTPPGVTSCLLLIYIRITSFLSFSSMVLDGYKRLLIQVPWVF